MCNAAICLLNFNFIKLVVGILSEYIHDDVVRGELADDILRFVLFDYQCFDTGQNTQDMLAGLFVL